MIDDVEGVRLPDGFVVYFPVWVIITESEFKKGGLANGLVFDDDGPAGVYLPVFTDRPQAEDVVRGDGAAGMTVVPIENKAHLWGVLELASRTEGVNHAGFDVAAGDATGRRMYTFTELRPCFPKPV